MMTVMYKEVREMYLYNEQGYQTGRWYFAPVEVLDHRYNALYNDKGQLLEETKFDKGIIPVIKNVYAYDSKGRPIGKSSYSQNNTLLGKDIFVYDTAGRRTDSILFDPYENISEKYSWQYDAKGRRTRETRSGPHKTSFVTEYEYNVGGQLSEEKHFTGGILDNKLRYFYTGKGEERKFFDGNDQIKTIAVLDSNKNIISRIVFKGNGEPSSTFSYLFDPSGNLLEEIEKDGTGYIISHLAYQYDNMNNKMETKRFFPNGKLDITVSWNYEYDQTGNWIKRTQFVNGFAGEVIKREIEYY